MQVTTDAPEVQALPAGQTQSVELALIDFGPTPRFHAPEEIAARAEDMKEKGQLQEVSLVRKGDWYEAVAGVGRILAARQLKWERIRAQVYDELSPYQKLDITFSENEERTNPNPIYQALILQQMMKAEDLNQAKLAARKGKTRTWLNQFLKLQGRLRLTPPIRYLAPLPTPSLAPPAPHPLQTPWPKSGLQSYPTRRSVRKAVGGCPTKGEIPGFSGARPRLLTHWVP